MSIWWNVIDEIEIPSTKPLGAEGSAARRAWELGWELKKLRAENRKLKKEIKAAKEDLSSARSQLDRLYESVDYDD